MKLEWFQSYFNPNKFFLKKRRDAGGIGVLKCVKEDRFTWKEYKGVRPPQELQQMTLEEAKSVVEAMIRLEG